MTSEERRQVEEDLLADLGGAQEICAVLGVKMARVRRWLERREAIGAPEPVLRLAQGNVYSLRAWLVWWHWWRATRLTEAKPKKGSWI